MSKKGDISLQVIVIAAIALLVLVVLSVIFMGRMGIFGEESGGTTYCLDTLGGQCSKVSDDEAKTPISCADAFGTGFTKVNVCNTGEGNCCKRLA